MGGDHGARGQRHEVLVLLDLRSPPADLDRFRRVYRVTQIASPRLIVVAPSPAQPPPSADDPAVAAVADEIGTAGLDDGEALFAQAWAARTAPKRRRGEGRSWGAPPG